MDSVHHLHTTTSRNLKHWGTPAPEGSQDEEAYSAQVGEREAWGGHGALDTEQTGKGSSGQSWAWPAVEGAGVVLQHLEVVLVQTMGPVGVASLGACQREHLEVPWAVEGPLAAGVFS